MWPKEIGPNDVFVLWAKLVSSASCKRKITHSKRQGENNRTISAIKGRNHRMLCDTCVYLICESGVPFFAYYANGAVFE